MFCCTLGCTGILLVKRWSRLIIKTCYARVDTVSHTESRPSPRHRVTVSFFGNQLSDENNEIYKKLQYCTPQTFIHLRTLRYLICTNLYKFHILAHPKSILTADIKHGLHRRLLFGVWGVVAREANKRITGPWRGLQH